ncbi:MAG: hypothetical protein QOI15_1216 [Pseudonocardiales bacterium]|nr:hypothetical protein [Pseudonocardiales bacterium]
MPAVSVHDMQSTIPNGLAGAPTGPELCALLASVDAGAVDDVALVDLLGAQWRQLAYQQAQVWAVMAEIARRDPMPNLPSGARWSRDEVFDSAVDEIRAELRLTRRSARRELENADAVSALPRVAESLSAGAIDRARAIVFADGCWDLTETQTATVLDALLAGAAEVTATRLAEKVRRLAIALDPGWAERRYKQAVRERRVVGYLNDDGSATVSGQNLPADEAAAACACVDALADAAKRAGAAAKIDHLRAELFLGLLDGRFHGLPESSIVDELLRLFPKPDTSAEHAAADRPAAQVSRGVELRVGLDTLLGRNDQPGEIAGWGPVTAPVARKIAAQQHRGEWRFAVVDDEGHAVFDSITRRRPRGDDAGAPRAGAPKISGGVVELHVPMALLSDTALLEQHAAWSAVLTDLAAQNAERQPIEQDPAARFPGRPLRRRVQIHFQRCLFAGCGRPASECDVDHRRDHSRGGPTDEENLTPGCRHDHRLKTVGGWRLVRRDDRTFVWISPLGRRHLVRVDPIAPPLPAPMPRVTPVALRWPDEELGGPSLTFAPRTRRGRPLTSAVTATAPPSTTGSAIEPPPF